MSNASIGNTNGKGNKGKIVSPSSRKKMSDSKKGKPAWNKGKEQKPLTADQRERLKEAVRLSWIKRKNKL